MTDGKLRSDLIRLAHAQPHLREKLLPLVAPQGERKTAMKSVPAFELVLKGAMRDYRKDPTAPVQTFDVLPKSLAFVRFDGLDAKTNKREAEALADFAMKSWDKGLGANYKGSFTVSRGPSGGGRTLSVDVIPDYYQTATIQVDKIDARGNRIKVARYEWSRDTGKWSVA